MSRQAGTPVMAAAWTARAATLLVSGDSSVEEVNRLVSLMRSSCWNPIVLSAGIFSYCMALYMVNDVGGGLFFEHPSNKTALPAIIRCFIVRKVRSPVGIFRPDQRTVGFLSRWRPRLAPPSGAPGWRPLL